MSHGPSLRRPHPTPARFLRAALTGSALALAGLAAAPVSLALDGESTVNGVPLACTGIGGEVRADPRWNAYNVRVEFSNAANEYLTDGAITLRDQGGRELLSVSCAGPWILLRLSDGPYVVEGQLTHGSAKPRSARFTPPAQGQTRVVLQFPDA